MGTVFLKLLNMSIAAGWLILAVAVVRLIFRRMPKWMAVALWALVGIRLAVPLSIESYLSLIPSAETVPGDIVYQQSPAIHTGIGVLNRAVNPMLAESLAANPTASVNPMQVVVQIAALVWLAGMAALLCHALVSFLRLRAKVQTAVLVRDGIFESENAATPFVLGLFRPRIYLPFGLSAEDIASAIAHETAHIRRRDHWIKPIGFVLLTVYWFNPLIWLAYILLCRDIELACDERAVRELGAEARKSYSSALVACSVGRRSISACPLAFGEVGVRERVKNVLNYKRPAFWIIVAALIASVALAACFLTNPKSKGDPAKAVGEYDAGMLGGGFGTDENPAYEIGRNAYGLPVFLDAKAAFEAIQEDCAAGFDYLSEQFGLDPVTEDDYGAYKTYGWQAGASDEAVCRQCERISQFFDIYENSFSTQTAIVATPTAEAARIYTGGALLGQSAMLSYLPKDGSYYREIILSGRSLGIINSTGELIFESGDAAVSNLARTELVKMFKSLDFFGLGEVDVPEYAGPEDMAIYSYYREDDPRNAAYSVYWFNGEPRWFAEGDMLRLYALEPLSRTGVYTSRRCVYLNPASSMYAFSDTGYRYVMDRDSFTIVNKATGETFASFTGIAWDWRDVGADDWRTLFPIDLMVPDISRYAKPLMLQLSGGYCLFDMDGALWLGYTYGGNTGMWSIHELMLGEATPVEWLYLPALSSQYPAFPFRFDFDYGRIEAECSEGSLIGFDDHDGTGYPSGKTLSLKQGSALYWSPQPEDAYSDAYALSSEISFTVFDADGAYAYRGVLSIVHMDNMPNPAGSALYSAVLFDCEGLSMREAEEGLGAVITPVSSGP